MFFYLEEFEGRLELRLIQGSAAMFKQLLLDKKTNSFLLRVSSRNPVTFLDKV